jgi:hypothetical protein
MKYDECRFTALEYVDAVFCQWLFSDKDSDEVSMMAPHPHSSLLGEEQLTRSVGNIDKRGSSLLLEPHEYTTMDIFV